MQAIANAREAPLSVITCPEFLRQGQALKDISSPERLVIGTKDIKAGKNLKNFIKALQSQKIQYTQIQKQQNFQS